MKIAYLTNQYPKVSHSFIRREITALEVSGVKILRVSIRTCGEGLIEPLDQQELAKTRVILDGGMVGLLAAFFVVILTKPGKFLRSLPLAFQLGLRSDLGIINGVIKHLIYLAEACVLLRWLKSEQVHHLHVHFGTNSTTVALLCRQLGGPTYSFTAHGPEEFDRAYNLSLPLKILQAKFVVAISDFGRSQLFRHCPSSLWQKIYVVRCGLDEEFFQQSLTCIPDNQHLVCVGRLCEQKGQLLLLLALQQLLEREREKYQNIHLTLVGDGEMRQPIEAFICEHNLQSHVTITGWASQNQVQQYIHDARVFVLPSFAEGLPVVLMEALAMQRPVISTYVAGIPELVQTGSQPNPSGWLIPPGSVSALVTAIAQALQTPTSELQQMGKNGQMSVIQSHHINRSAEQLIRLFDGGDFEANQFAVNQFTPETNTNISAFPNLVKSPENLTPFEQSANR